MIAAAFFYIIIYYLATLGRTAPFTFISFMPFLTLHIIRTRHVELSNGYRRQDLARNFMTGPKVEFLCTPSVVVDSDGQ